MGLQIDQQKCIGCGECVNICPGDLLLLDQEAKCVIRSQAECWDCMACVKSCPSGALETRLPFSLADHGASLKPELAPDQIRWVCKYPDNKVEEFILPRSW